MEVDARYERYWAAEAPSPVTDPRTPARQRLLFARLPQPEGRPARLLDVGAGDGGLVAEAAVGGVEAVGLELSGAAIERAATLRPGLDLRRHSAEDLPWPVDDGSFDVVASFEVVEHLLEPKALVAGAHRALRPGGLFVVSTPYHGLLKNLALATFAFDRHFAVDGDHVRFFTDRALVALLEDGGFAVERVDHLGRVRGLWANTVAWARKA